MTFCVNSEGQCAELNLKLNQSCDIWTGYNQVQVSAVEKIKFSSGPLHKEYQKSRNHHILQDVFLPLKVYILQDGERMDGREKSKWEKLN